MPLRLALAVPVALAATATGSAALALRLPVASRAGPGRGTFKGVLYTLAEEPVSLLSYQCDSVHTLESKHNNIVATVNLNVN